MTFVHNSSCKYLVVLSEGITSVADCKPELCAAAIENVAKAGGFAVAVEQPGDFAELTGKQMLSLRNGVEGATKVKKFVNDEKNRQDLFAMVANGGKALVIASAETAPTTGDSVPAQSKPQETTMTTETKTKTAKGKGKKAVKAVKKAPTPRAKAPLTIELPTNLKPPAGTTTGCYIRSLVMLGKSTEEILAKVKANYPDTTAKGSDVSWNRGKLRAAGKKVPDAAPAKKAE